MLSRGAGVGGTLHWQKELPVRAGACLLRVLRSFPQIWAQSEAPQGRGPLV